MNDLKFDAAIFDMDGLMLDTEKPMLSSFVKAGKSLGLDIGTELAKRTIGLSSAGSRELVLQECGPNFPYDDFYQKHSQFCMEEFEKGIACKPGLLELLDHLKSLKIPLAVATSTSREKAFWKLDKAGIKERFTVFACGNEVTRGKPAPDIFLLAAERLGIPPSLCIGFEDSPAGLLGLHAAGIRSVFVKDLVEPSAEILSSVWKRYEDLAQAIELFY